MAFDAELLSAAITNEMRQCTPLSSVLIAAYERHDYDDEYGDAEAVRDAIAHAYEQDDDYLLRDCRMMLAQIGLRLSAFYCLDTPTPGGAA